MTNRKNWVITKWCKTITINGQDIYTHKKLEGATQKFRLLDDDKEIYCYGVALEGVDFEPLDNLMPVYGCTEIQYKNEKTGKYETL